VLRLVLIGLAAGLFGAILGVGGGLVVVPLLVYLFGYDQRRAAATSLGGIGITVFVGAVSYGFRGRLHVPEAALVGVPAAVGVVFGAALQQRVPLRLLSALFACLLVLVGLRLLEPGWFGFHAIAHRAWWVYVAAVAIGLAAGTLAGMFGIGGGILLVPTLALALGLAQLDAEASSLLAMLPASWIGAWRQTRYGNVVWRSSLVIGAASVAGVEGGIAIAERLPEATLQRLFACLLLATAAQVAWRARRQ
jgi:uncharacterized membrane protein YfcA